ARLRLASFQRLARAAALSCSSQLLPSRLAASTTTAAAAVAAVSAAAAAAESTFGFGPGLVDRQGAAAHLVLVEFRSGLLSLFVGRHLDERESAGAPRRRVAHHADRFDRSGAAEQLLQLGFANRVGKIAHVKPATQTLFTPHGGGTSLSNQSEG